ncbi:MAG: hypothetical protein KC416_07950 [Myxococcales bacterium]|nr:hypothetical protein [Myxococcales bacterium]
MKKSIALFGIALMGGSLLGCSSDEGASCTKLEIMAGAPGCSTPTGGGPGLGNDGGTAGPADPNMPVPGGNDIDPEDVDREDPPMPGGNNPPGGGGGNPPGGGGGNPPGGGMQCADPYGAWKDDPANTVSACANDMIPCLSACDINDSACIQGCTAAVPTCQACVLHNWQYCQGRECDTDYQAAMCCVDANSCTDDACIQANCGTEVTAFQNCVGSPATAAVCDDFNSAGYSECFDGGVAPPPPPPAMCVNTTYGTYVEDGGKAKDCAGELADCLATCDINDTTCIFDTCLGDASNECASCVQWNYQTCWPRTCKAEYEALECCEQAGGNCAAEDSAYETCYLSAATEVICDDFHGEVFEECFGAATPKACEAPPALYPDGYEYCTGTT